MTDGIERLRSEGIIVIEGSNNDERVHIDEYILNIMSDVIVKNGTSNLELNRILVEYAAGRESEQGSNSDQSKHHICHISQMGYLLVQHNSLPDKEIIHLMGLVESKQIGTSAIADIIDHNQHNKKGNTTTIAERMIEIIAEKQDGYSKRFAAAAVASFNSFNRALICINTYKKQQNNEAALTLFKETTYTMFSASKRSMTMAQERKV